MRRLFMYLTPVLVGMTISSVVLATTGTPNPAFPPCGGPCKPKVHGADCEPCCDTNCDPVHNVDDHFKCIQACDY